MADYTFHSLSDADFEDLACDLLRAALQLPFQPFTKGRDSGVDLLAGKRLKGSVVVQCKHYCRSKYANLKSKIVAEEVPKLARLKPSRFILATSLGLTPQNKEELLGLLSPYCLGIDDIYGQDDINALLNHYPTVEVSHYKLWLTSVPVLQRILRHGASVWNAMTKDDIERKMSLYVQTAAYEAARNILIKNNSCILSGIPGIGKTTLAQVLVTRFMDDGFELIAVRDDIQEAFDALDLSRQQVVYYDDFLGQSSIDEKLGKNEDKGIVRLLKEARRAKQLKVVFTTREYILEDAKRVYEPLNANDLDVAKCIVKVEDYTRGHRARILYNHLYFSGLDREYTTALLKDRAYRRIVDHKGYSPRIIEWMTLGAGPNGVPPKNYVKKFTRALDDPTEVWQHAFENQISDAARTVLYCLGTIDGWLGSDELALLWARIFQLPSIDGLSIENRRVFLAALKQLDGSFIRTGRMGSETAVEFHNPSIKEFVRKRITADDGVQRSLLRSSLFFEQVSCLVRLANTGRVGRNLNVLLLDDPLFHGAIERTITSQTCTYQMVNYAASGVPFLLRTRRDLGERFTSVANWAKKHASTALLSELCRVATKIVEAGDAETVATIGSCGFLSAIVNDEAESGKASGVVLALLPHISTYMRSVPTPEEWITWSDFLKGNAKLFEEQLDEWTQEAESFCRNEIDLIIRQTASPSEAEEQFQDVASVAERWSLSLEPEFEEFNKWLAKKMLRDEQPSDDPPLESHPVSPTNDDDDVIDRLFDSLDEKASESVA